MVTGNLQMYLRKDVDMLRCGEGRWWMVRERVSISWQTSMKKLTGYFLSQSVLVLSFVWFCYLLFNLWSHLSFNTFLTNIKYLHPLLHFHNPFSVVCASVIFHFLSLLWFVCLWMHWCQLCVELFPNVSTVFSGCLIWLPRAHFLLFFPLASKLLVFI